MASKLVVPVFPPCSPVSSVVGVFLSTSHLALRTPSYLLLLGPNPLNSLEAPGRGY